MFTLQIDHNRFFLVCGIGENQHTGHPPLHSNKIRSCKCFLTFPPWKLLLQYLLLNLAVSRRRNKKKKARREVQGVLEAQTVEEGTVLPAVQYNQSLTKSPAKIQGRERRQTTAAVSQVSLCYVQNILFNVLQFFKMSSKMLHQKKWRKRKICAGKSLHFYTKSLHCHLLTILWGVYEIIRRKRKND